MSGVESTPTPATLRVTNSREGREEALVVRSRGFQSLAEETRVPTNVVAGMFYFHYSSRLIIFFLLIMCLYVYDVMFSLVKSPPKDHSSL